MVFYAMDLETIRIRQCTIKKKMNKWGHGKLADDAAQEYIADILDGKRVNQTIDQFLIDFFRKHFGDRRSLNGKYKFFYSRTISIDLFDDYLIYEPDLDHSLLLQKLVGDDIILIMYYVCGYTQEEIAARYGITDSRVSQLLKEKTDSIRDRV